MYINRKIVEIFDNDLAKSLQAATILDGLPHDDYVLLRRSLKKRLKSNDPHYLCDLCGTPLELSCTPDGQGSHEFFFRHFRDPDFDKCPIKTNIQRTAQEILRDQYAFKKESKPHIQLKEAVSKIIRTFIDHEVIVDSKYINDRFDDPEKRKPDIYFKSGERELVIEFQVNNTFHSVIEEREAFYQRNKISLFWVFGYFNPLEFQPITTKDIYVPNYNNAFVFDKDAEEKSLEKGTLCLKVFYKVYSVEAGDIAEKWMEEMIELKDLTFDIATHRPFYANCPELKQIALLELEEAARESRQREIDKGVEKKIKAFKDFLSAHKNNDLIYNNWIYYLSKYSDYELAMLNENLNLRSYKKDGKDIFQQLLNQGNHSNLVQFLLRAYRVDIYVNNSMPETTLTTILQSSHIYKHELIKSLFLRGYKLSDSDIEFIKQKEQGFESSRQIKKYKYFEQVQTEGALDLVADNLNELFVIECAKEGKIELLGNGVQGPVWLANLAITQYARYWPIFDNAFKVYGFYPSVLHLDTKATFQKKLTEIDISRQESYPLFETVAKTLFPELRQNAAYPHVII